MNYVDLDIMTRGTGDTELEPSEEFPILFGLLTAPMTSGNGGGSHSKPHSYMSKFSLSKIPQIEADSSAMSDDSCISEDDTSSSIFSDTIDEDSMDTDIESNSNEAVSSSPKNILDFYRKGKKGEGEIEDTDAFPTSTTVDDEDFDELMVSRSRPLDIFNQHSSNNNCRPRERSRTLKRSYDQISQGSRKDSSMQIVDVQVHATNSSNSSDTEDDEIKDICQAENGIQQRLRLFQVSYSSPETPEQHAKSKNKSCSQPESGNHYLHNVQTNHESSDHIKKLSTSRPHQPLPIKSSTTTTDLLPTVRQVNANNYFSILSAKNHSFMDKLIPPQNHNFPLCNQSGLPESGKLSTYAGDNVQNAKESSFTPWCTSHVNMNLNTAHFQATRTNNAAPRLSTTISDGNQTQTSQPNNSSPDEESVLQFNQSFTIKQSTSNNHTISKSNLSQQPIDTEANRLQ